MALKEVCKKGTKIVETTIDSPIGFLKLSSCQTGLHSIKFDNQFNSNEENFTPKLNWNSSRPGKTDLTTLHLDKVSKWIQCYFETPEKFSSDVPIKENGTFEFCLSNSTEFEKEVLMALFQETKMGDTLTYRQLAEKVNRPNASRAVGTAMKKNPIPILIPCHRVVRSDGSIGNYGGGNKMKEFLINHEKGKRNFEK